MLENWIEVSTNLLINRNKAECGHCAKRTISMFTNLFTGPKLKANINPLCMTSDEGKVGRSMGGNWYSGSLNVSTSNLGHA